MALLFDLDEVPDDVRAEAAHERRQARGRAFCSECHCTGGHATGCPEDDEVTEEVTS